MIVTALQIAAVLAIALYLVHWQRSTRRRNAQSWESLLARLRPEWSARELSDQFLRHARGCMAAHGRPPRPLGDVSECARHA